MSDDKRIAEALKNREEDAAELLVDAYAPRLLRSAFLLCGNETDAQDIVQDTLITAMKAARKFRGASPVYTWLHGIMRNVTRHFFRARKTHVALDAIPDPPDQSDQSDPSDQADRTATREVVVNALRALSPDHRDVLVMRYFEDMKISDIARQLGVRPGTIKSRLHYAIDQLRQRLPSDVNPFDGQGHSPVERPI